MSRSGFAIALFTLTLAACADNPTALPDEAERRASVLGGDSRARWVFADAYQSAVDELGNPVYSPAGIRSDGLGAYEGGVCGVMTRIFWYDQSASRSGD